MLDHVTIGVEDIKRSQRFYDQALQPLGITRHYGDGNRFTGYGIDPKAFFWIGIRNIAQTGSHIAFAADDRGKVDRFYQAAIAAGGKDNGPPGIRPHYDPNYYGAFVFDPDGHNIEAVCRQPEKH